MIMKRDGRLCKKKKNQWLPRGSRGEISQSCSCSADAYHVDEISDMARRGVEEEDDDSSKMTRRVLLREKYEDAHKRGCLEPEISIMGGLLIMATESGAKYPEARVDKVAETGTQGLCHIAPSTPMSVASAATSAIHNQR